MSETDSFIEEVTEEVRRDKLFGYLKKYGWIAVVVVLGAVGTTAWLEYQKAQKTAAAQALGDQILAANGQPTAQDRATALAAIVPEAGEAAVIVQLQQAGELVAAGDKSGALAVLDAIAANSPLSEYRDQATLKALILRGKDMDQAARATALEALAVAGEPFRPLAQEQLAVIAIEAGDPVKAISLLSELFLDSQATAALRSRASQMIIALGGEVPENPQLQLNQ